MKQDIMDIIAEQSCHAQGSLDWFRDRLGCITSSNVGKLMGECPEDKEYKKLLSSTSLKRGETQESRDAMLAQLKEAADKARPDYLSDGAISYLRELAAERNLKRKYIEDDALFQEYLDRTATSTKAIRYGSENEAFMREAYRVITKNEVVECGFIRSKEIDMYGDSPDGIVLNADGEPIRAIEIKCPQPDTFLLYAENIVDAQSLKEIKPQYYWQCMSHIECCREYFGCDSCDFVFGDKMQNVSFKCIHIEPNEEDIALMKQRVIAGNRYIAELLDKVNGKGK